MSQLSLGSLGRCQSFTSEDSAVNRQAKCPLSRPDPHGSQILNRWMHKGIVKDKHKYYEDDKLQQFSLPPGRRQNHFPRFPSMKFWLTLGQYQGLGSLKTTEVYFSQFWRLEVWDHSTSLVGFWWGPSSWLEDSLLLAVSSCGREIKRRSSTVSLLIRAWMPSWGPHHHDLI